MKEISHLLAQLNDVYSGNPWFGRSVRELLSEVDESIAFQKTSGQHSIVELLWHMCTWKEFTINRIQKDASKTIEQFDLEDWKVLDHSDSTLWKKGLIEFEKLQNELVEILGNQSDDFLDQKVQGKKYNFRQLLNGIIQHDIYHIGQIAYIRKMLM